MMYSLARGRAALLAVCLIFAVQLPTFGQEPAGGSALVPVARALKVAQAPSLDGRVAGDPAWEAVPPLTDFWQTAPDAGQPASERTEVRIAYTEDALYVGVTLYDRSSEGLTLSDSRRDSPLDDVDSFRILLDTYKDRQNGFVFATNPAALEYDGQVIGEGGMNLGGGGGGGGRQQAGSGGGFNLNWDGAWRVRTAMTDDGWSAEFEIPFRTLRYEPGTAREWGLNFQRTIRRRKESAYWAPLPFQFDLLKVSQAGTLAGLDLPAQRNLKLIPYALGEVRERGVATSRTTTLGDIGLDAKYSLTPSLTLDATVNTDFAQVEVDEQQVNLDRFNLFFPEKRPFFLENAGLFAVGASGEAEVFFSRRIGIAANGEEIPIIAGGRLSGKAGPVNVGLLNMQTEDTVGTPMNNFTVARVRRDFANRSNLGAIFVGRVATGGTALPDDHNASFAVDGRWGIGRTGLISGFAARSATPGVSSDQHAYQIGARNETQPLTLNVALTETGRNFNPEVGFLSRRGGFRKFEALAFSRLRPKSLSTFQEIRPHAIYRGYWNPSGFLETGFLHMDSHWELKNSWEFHTGVNVTREGVVVPFDIVPGVPVPAGVYENAETQLVLQSNQGASVYGRMQVTKGGFFNGNRVAYNPQLRVRMGETLNVEMSLERNDVDLQTGSFITNLARMRASYSFSPRLFVQSLIQYNDRADAWTSNFRFGWLQQANTGLFLVYTDSHDLDERALVPPTGTNRSLTLKISRMFDALN